MRIEILGSGGAVTIPQPLCDCMLCEKARSHGIPEARTGPSIFVHGPDILFDTPEETKSQLNRAGIKRIAACFYSHWHPDHVMGRRVWEMNMDWLHLPRQNRVTDIYMTSQVAADFRQRLGSWEQMSYLAHLEVVRLHVSDDPTRIGSTLITPLRLPVGYVDAFFVVEDNRRALLVLDEHLGWQPGSELGKLDLLVMPMGVTEFHPLTGARLIPSNHPVLKSEATFTETLQLLQKVDATRIVLSHIEEPMGLSHQDLQQVARKVAQEEGIELEFAYDGLTIEL